MSKNRKSKQLMLGILTTSIGLSPVASFALQPSSGGTVDETQHVVPLAGTNVDGQLVKPNQGFTINVDKTSADFQKVREQLQKQSFGVLIVADNGEKMLLDASAGDVSYNTQDATISIDKHADFSRFTSYVATVLVKSEYQQALKGNLPSFSNGSTVSFKTGSAIGEAVNVLASLDKDAVRVTETNHLNVKVTDSYGDPATNGTLKVAGQGNGNAKVASTFQTPSDIAITDGEAQVDLNDHSANTVNLSYEVQDNQYQDAQDDNKGSDAVAFTPGKTAKADVTLPEKIKVGNTYNITGVAEDVYGNNVEDGTAFNETTDKGTISNETPTVNGKFKFDYQAPTKVGKGGLSISGDDFTNNMDNALVIHPEKTAQVQIQNPDKIRVGNTYTVSGIAQDMYGNNVEDGTAIDVTADNGSVSNDVATADGEFKFDYQAPTKVGTSGLSVVSSDGYSTNFDKQFDIHPEKTAQVQIQNPDKIKVGNTYTISGVAQDKYGNNVENGTGYDLNVDNGSVSNEQTTVDGVFKFDYEASTKVGTSGLAISGDDFTTNLANAFSIRPEKTAIIHVQLPSKIVAGQSYKMTGDAEDKYGNFVDEGTAFNVLAVNGTVSNELPTANGVFGFNFLAPTQIGTEDLSVSGDNYFYTMKNGIVVVASTPSKLIMNVPSSITAGQNVTVSGSVKDVYGNPIASQPVTISGALSGTVTSDANGNYSATLKANSTGSVTATVGGVNVPVTNASGTPITSVAVSSPAPAPTPVSSNYGTPLTISLSVTANGRNQGYTVTGTVYNAYGSGSSYADVSIYEGGYGRGMVRTDANGKFTFTNKYATTGQKTIYASAYTYDDGGHSLPKQGGRIVYVQ